MIDFRRSQPKHAPLSISGRTVERVENIKFLRVQISQDLTWNKDTSGILKQTQQRLYFLRRLKQVSLPISILRTFYSDVVQSVLTYCISTWYSSCCMSDKNALQRIVGGAERVIRVSLPSVQELFLQEHGAEHHQVHLPPSHHILDSGKQFWSQKGRTNRRINSFLPQTK